MHYTIEEIIETDPTLKQILRESEFDSNNFKNQVDIMGGAILVALGKWLDKEYAPAYVDGWCLYPDGRWVYEDVQSDDWKNPTCCNLLKGMI